MNETQQKEFLERRAKFLEKYKAVIDEFQCDFIAYPQYIPNEKGTYDLKVIMDILDKKYTKQEIKSPFV